MENTNFDFLPEFFKKHETRDNSQLKHNDKKTWLDIYMDLKKILKKNTK